jgi:hypothetical protein
MSMISGGLRIRDIPDAIIRVDEAFTWFYSAPEMIARKVSSRKEYFLL